MCTLFNINSNTVLLFPSLSNKQTKFSVFFCFSPSDFEYCSYNYRAFDIANHFCEWVYNYTKKDHPYYTMTPSDAPTKEQKLRFIRAYLDEQGSKENPEEVLQEVEVFMLASHMMWSLWGVVNADISQITFGHWVSFKKNLLTARNYTFVFVVSAGVWLWPFQGVPASQGVFAPAGLADEKEKGAKGLRTGRRKEFSRFSPMTAVSYCRQRAATMCEGLIVFLAFFLKKSIDPIARTSARCTECDSFLWDTWKWLFRWEKEGRWCFLFFIPVTWNSHFQTNRCK